MVLATLSLFKESYAQQARKPDDLGVLSLRDDTLYALNAASDHFGLTKFQVGSLNYGIFCPVRQFALGCNTGLCENKPLSGPEFAFGHSAPGPTYSPSGQRPNH